MPIEDKSIPLKVFLNLPMFASFRLGNLTMTLSGPSLGNQWQSSMLEESDIQLFEQLESCFFQF